jgi:DNA-binding transcriptional ArsR family regulator
MYDSDDSRPECVDDDTEPSDSDDADRTTLLLTDSTAVADHDAWESLVVPDDREVSVLSVTYTESIDDIVEQVWNAVGGLPTDLGIISFDEMTRSGRQMGVEKRPESPITLTTMSDPKNLKGLGTAMRLYLDEWCEKPTRSILCFTSLTHFVRHVSLEDAVQFIEEVETLLAETDAVGHFHLDPDAVDDEVVARLRPAFDVVRDETGRTRSVESLTTGVIHRLLGEERRRFALAYLHRADVPVTMRTLAEHVAAWEEGVEPADLTPERIERARTSLATSHVPLLKDAGVVESDEDGTVVQFTQRAEENETLQTLLDLASNEYDRE